MPWADYFHYNFITYRERTLRGTHTTEQNSPQHFYFLSYKAIAKLTEKSIAYLCNYSTKMLTLFCNKKLYVSAL